MPLTNKDIIEHVLNTNNQARIIADTQRFNVFNGKLKDAVRAAIAQEFTRPETIVELSNRVIPINIVQKIINRLATVYMQPPKRRPLDRNPADQELIDLYATPMKINMNGKHANRFFKLHKHTAWEPYLDRDGIPRVRTLPSQTYTPMSDDPREPNRPTVFVKHMIMDQDKKKQRFTVWTDETFRIVNGEGDLQVHEMLELNNPEGVNPFGVIPFTYISEADDGNLIPIPDDDLITMQIVISVLLTDLAFASKYSLWSMLLIKGTTETQNIDFNPNSIISLPPGVDLEVIKPQVDTEKGLMFIESLVGMLLTTKNLSVGDITGQASVQSSVSGIAKMIDRAESTEDKEDQEAFFIDAEKRFWDKFAHNILPVWVSSGQINSEFVGKFSEDFELSIQFPDPKPFVGDRETVDLEKVKLDNAFTTRKMALQAINPGFEEQEIEDLNDDILKETLDSMSFLERNSKPKDTDDGIEVEVKPS